MLSRMNLVGVTVAGVALLIAACSPGPSGPQVGMATATGTGPLAGVESVVAPGVAGTEAPSSSAGPAASMAGAAASTALSPGGRLDAVRARGKLVCGVQDQLPGFGFLNPEGRFEGFDVDFCRALAAAVLGDREAVTFRPLSAQERFSALQTGEVDVLFRNTTWTLSRDTQNGLDFGPTTFYDGQGMMVPRAGGAKDLADLNGASICVGSGTTTEKNLGDAMRKIGATYTPVVLQDTEQVFGAYDQGRCDAVTADKSQLASRLTTLKDPSAHAILDLTMSKEPLGPGYAQGDPRWADVVNWVVYGLLQAEEFGISSENVQEQLASTDPEVRRFLGVEDALGEGLGLSNDFMVKVIQSVGNYGEIYDRNLGPTTRFNLPRALNRLWRDGGLLYSPPFR